jgi:hypothetical protein
VVEISQQRRAKEDIPLKVSHLNHQEEEDFFADEIFDLKDNIFLIPLKSYATFLTVRKPSVPGQRTTGFAIKQLQIKSS